MKRIILKSYAKINLGLNVLGKNSEGYHTLDMIMLPIQLHDSVLIEKLPRAQDDYITIDDYSIEGGTHNIASKAVDSIRSLGKFDQKFRIFIHKVIPMKGGLGGGSSNAAFTILGTNQLMCLNIPQEKLLEIAKPLGADVPFFINCVPARCQGIGDTMKPITIKNNYYVLLVKPEQGCSTKEIFKAYDSNKGNNCDIDLIEKALAEGDDETIAKEVSNALENAALEFVPQIKKIKDRLLELGLSIVSMTGSGSTVFAMSTNKKLIHSAALALEDYYQVEETKLLK